MMKIYIILLLVFNLYHVSSIAQTEQILEKIENDYRSLLNNFRTLQNENSKVKSDIEDLNIKLSSNTEILDSLKQFVEMTSAELSLTKTELEVMILEKEKRSGERIEAVDQSLSKTSLYGIIAVLSVLLLSSLLYVIVSKRQRTDKSDLIGQLTETRNNIEESLVKEFGKQTMLMEAQLQLIETQKTETKSTPEIEPDHSLALKLASEINLIERNINLMDAGTKGLKQLTRSVEKLKDNLAANGYEMPILLGKEFHEGMRVIVVNSIPDENLEKDSEIISKVLIPQVNYKDKMIQTAQIEVTIGV